MKRTALTVAFMVFLSVFTLTILVLPEARATTLYVGGGGPGNYTTIQGAIDDASPGSTVFVFNGTYYENIMVNRTLNLVGEDMNTTTIDGGNSEDVIHAIANWVNISGFTVRDGGFWPQDAGIDLRNSNNSLVTNIKVTESFVGIHVYESHGTTITDTIALDNAFSIYAERSDNVTIANNTIQDDSRGISLFLSDNSNIVGNSISSEREAIELVLSVEAFLANNTMVNSGIDIRGGNLDHWNTHTIDTSNTVNGKPVRYWKDTIGGVVPSDTGQVILAKCAYVVVENLNVSNASTGILLGYSLKNSIVNNTAVSNSIYGIQLYRSERNVIVGNNFSRNYNAGVRLGYSTRNIIEHNTLLSNYERGILLFQSSSNNVSFNNITNSSRGISIIDYSRNLVTSNMLFLNRDYGIYLNRSNWNRIYHNVFLSNAQQAFDNRNSNQWDNGYPSGGNYWSDYAGIDERRGPAQDVNGSDGIGDTPYVIDADSQDRYPMISPLSLALRPPEIRGAILSGNRLENVTVSWSLSPDDGGGIKSVVSYGILRNTSYDGSGRAYHFVGFAANGTSEFTDSLAGEGDPDNYFYRVCAVDLFNYSRCGENQAAKFTRPLAPGPNLISIPLIQSNDSIEIVLETVKYDRAWSHDSFSLEWTWYMTFKTYRRGLLSVNHTMGLWVNVTGDCNFTVAGVVPLQTTIHLRTGWNLISFPSLNSSYSVSDLKAEIGATRVEGYDPAPPCHLRVLGDAEVLQTGHGYWLRAEMDTDWIVEVS